MGTSSVLSYPDIFTPVPREALLRVARLGGYSTQQEALDAPEEVETPSVDDMLELICRDYPHELALDTASHEDGSEYFYLAHCPFVGRRHEGSNRKSTFIVIRPNGKVGFHCYAGKCASKGFGALLRLLWKRTGRRPSVPVLVRMLETASEIPDSVAAKWGLLEPDQPPPSPIAIIPPVEVVTRRVFAGTPSTPRPPALA